MKHEPCSEQIVVRVPPALRDEIQKAAVAEGRSLGNLARRLIERALAEQRGSNQSVAA
ncbi:MAG: ribbon-helix-helix domain-containing protein [Xanthobacteraceae bacterium]